MLVEHPTGASPVSMTTEEHDGKAVVRPLLAKQWFAKARPLIHEEAASYWKTDDESEETAGRPSKKK